MRWRGAAAASAIVLAIALARCFEEPDYTGLACSEDAPCPAGFFCNESLLCEQTCVLDRDCPSATTCIAGRCALPADEQDGGVSDAAGSEDGGPCSEKTCDQPPPAECIDDNTKYRSHSGVGQCDPASGDCVYAEIVIDCLDCLASCLLRCE